MSVELNPSSQLGFHRPLTQLVKRTLTISNQNAQPVAFKVKTTAPKQYCVRPNSGRIEPGERVEVQVLLQPMKEEPAPGTKCRDKFLVQSAYITPDREHTPVQDLWSIVEAEHKAGNPDAIAEQKIRCAFLPPIDGSTEGGLGSVQESAAEDGSPSMSRHGQSAFLAAESTPSKFTNGSNDDGLHTAPSSAFADRSAPAIGTDVNGSSLSSGQNATAPATGVVEKLQAAGLPTNTSELKTAATSAANTVSNAASNAAASVGLASQPSTGSTAGLSSSGANTSDSLQRDLSAARAEIEKLKATIREKESEGLRQRNVGSTGSGSTSSAVGSQVATVKQEGIPAQMVAALCFGVFLFTWLFF